MRRKSRRSLLNLALFGGVLFLIIYINQSPSKKVFAWSTIRYQTTSTTLPEARGVCPGLADTSKPALIVSRVAADGNSSWLDPLAEKYHQCIYNVDAPADATSNILQVPANRGHEAMTYLTFIIDNYADIPAAGAVFVHGSRWAWHNDSPDYDNAALLAALNITSALALNGYHNMKCDWSASTCPASSGPPQGSLETSLNTILQPWSARAASDAAMPRAFAALFGDGITETKDGQRVLLGRGDPVRAQCCAQFVVSRAAIHRHSRAEYVALRQWLLDGSSGARNRNAAPSDDRIAGRIISYLWHILFIEQEDGVVDLDRLNQQACPSAQECYCRLYGRCDLKGCRSPEFCYGQYYMPPTYKLPADWEATHSKDTPRDI